MTLPVKWILFDFGGCLDSDGMHSRTLFFNEFEKAGLLSFKTPMQPFQDAYSYGDQTIITESLAVNAGLLEMNVLLCNLIAQRLKISERFVVVKTAQAITEIQAGYLRRNQKVIKELRRRYELGIISNFSGNLAKILNDFSLFSFFAFVLDSYHVGLCKPGPEIFKRALERCDVPAEQTCFVGDNIERDIIPAKRLGMRTVLINPCLQKTEADYTLASVEELLILTQTT
ncbi:MAG: hypothetical protein A2X86_10905 [Bdellovibrionales bacterium GWA2_49_15]|nr:MAG: hypothetical protein A2X86_10905 [Bdellovibrionales bacterium GWA2_49_15]HAZ11485.1 hypothetical protein [Bdellovibrionales bacterium]